MPPNQRDPAGDTPGYTHGHLEVSCARLHSYYSYSLSLDVPALGASGKHSYVLGDPEKALYLAPAPLNHSPWFPAGPGYQWDTPLSVLLEVLKKDYT